MEYQIKPCGYWNSFENCEKEALKYKNRTEFHDKVNATYKVALKNNWLDIYNEFN